MSGTTGTPGSTGLARSGAAMAAGTLASRILGMVRGVLIAAVLGIGLTSGTFDVANTLPNSFYLLLAGGVLNAVLVPQIAKAAAHDDGGERYVNRLLTLALAIMAGATVLATSAAPLLIWVYTWKSRWNSDATGLAVVFAFICLPQIFFYGLYTLLGQVLNARGRFAAYMWAPAAANVVAIGGLLVFLGRGLPRKAAPADWTPGMIWLIAGTATLGIVVQALVLVIPLRRSGFRYRPVWGFRGVGLGSASRVAGWTFAAVAVSQVGFIVTTQVLTHADGVAGLGVQATGKNVYTNAFILFMLPHSLITVSLVTALFTRMSYAATSGRAGAVVADIQRGLRMPAVLLIPLTVGGVLLAPLLTRSIYLGNTSGETNAIAVVMAVMLVGLVPYGWLYLIQRAFYAYEDAKTPFVLQCVVTAVATVFNLASFLLSPQLVGVGVGVGQTVSNLVGALVGFVLLRRRLGPLRLGGVLRQNVRLTAASLTAALVAYVGLRLLGAALGDGRLADIITFLVVGTGFLLVALALAGVLRVREVREVLDPVLRRVRRTTS